MRGSRSVAAAALLAVVACGGDAAPEATPTTAPPDASPAPAGPARADVAATLRDAAVAAEAYHVDASVYPPDVARLRELGFTPKPGVSVDVLSPGKTYVCLKATGGNVTLYYSTAVGKPSETPCS